MRVGQRSVKILGGDGLPHIGRKAKAASDNVDTISAQQDTSPSYTLLNQDSVFELSKLIDLSALEQQYNIEAGCYIDKVLPLDLESKVQEGLTTSTSVQYYSLSLYYNNNRNIQCILEESMLYSLLELLDKNSSKESNNNISELEKDLLLAFEE